MSLLILKRRAEQSDKKLLMKKTISKNVRRSQIEEEQDEEEELPDSWQVSFEWIHRQLGRVLELFIVLQFVAGAVLFFLGIFLLLWGVVPATSLRAASYMLLAFYFIGRASLGLFGYYTDHFCVIFMYGVLMVATGVTRTIMILVRLKIGTSPVGEVEIPPFLYAAPGAVQIPIEMICGVLEFSQAICSFYMCFIIAKSQEFQKKLKQQNDLNRVLIAANRHVEDYIAKMMDKLEQKKMPKKEGDEAEELSITDVIQNYQAINKEETTSPRKATFPLKGILHQPSNYTQHDTTSTRHDHKQQRENFNRYDYKRNRSQSLGIYNNNQPEFFFSKVVNKEKELPQQQQHVSDLKQVHEVDRINSVGQNFEISNKNRVNYANVAYFKHQQENVDENEERWVGDSDEYELIDYSDPATYMPKSNKKASNQLGLLPPTSRDFMNFSPITATSMYGDGRQSAQSEKTIHNAMAMSPTPQPELNFATHRSPLLLMKHIDNINDVNDHPQHQHYGTTAPVYVNPILVNYAHYRRQQQQRRELDIEGR